MTREIWFDYVDDDHDYEDRDIEEENVLSWHKLSKWVSPRPQLTLGGHIRRHYVLHFSDDHDSIVCRR